MKRMTLLFIILIFIISCQRAAQVPEINNEVSAGAQSVEKELNDVQQVNEELEINELDSLDQELQSLEQIE